MRARRKDTELSFKFVAEAAVAVVIVAASHVFWDSFTHRGRWGTRLVPRLNDVASSSARRSCSLSDVKSL